MAKITRTDIYRFSIPMKPFTIATGTMDYAQNTFIRVHTEDGIYGVGECSAFPMIVGETQSTCFEMAKEFAAVWKGKEAADIRARMAELHAFTAFNATIKSAFDMALYDLAAKAAGQPLFKFLGGTGLKELETDITVGIDTPAEMAVQARAFVQQGFRIIKIKLGKDAIQDIERVKTIRASVSDEIVFRIDANQGWSFEDAITALTGMKGLGIAYCEQPMRTYNDHHLPELRRISPVRIMADESVFNHHDAERVIGMRGCDYVNIKFAKSGGIQEALEIDRVCADAGIACMMGGMLESRVALTAFAHFATASPNILFNDMDTCMLGHQLDPVTGGVKYNGYLVELPDTIGIGADADDAFLESLVSATI